MKIVTCMSGWVRVIEAERLGLANACRLGLGLKMKIVKIVRVVGKAEGAGLANTNWLGVR